MILSLLRAARILVGLLAILCMTLVRVRAATTVHDPPHAEPAPSHAPSRPESVPVPIGNESTNVAPVSLPGSDAPAAGEGSEDGEGADEALARPQTGASEPAVATAVAAATAADAAAKVRPHRGASEPVPAPPTAVGAEAVKAVADAAGAANRRSLSCAMYLLTA